MYSLLVTQQVANQSLGAFDIERSRYLEYTSEAISAQFKSLSIEAEECIKSWPCILMQVGRGQEEAFVVQITSIEIVNTTTRLTAARLPLEFTLLNETLWRNRIDLDIEQFEFSRNHLAVKDRNFSQL